MILERSVRRSAPVFVATALRSAANFIEAEGARLATRAAPRTPLGAYDFIRSFEYGSIKPHILQVPSEFTRLLDLLADRQPRRLLEIGTFEGVTLFCFTRVASSDAVLATVDLPPRDGGFGYPRSWRRWLSGFGIDGQTIHLVRADSHSDATASRIRRIFGDAASLDFLFIDGDHSYDGARDDYERYSPLVRDGGLIAFHDIVPGDDRTVGEVPRYWQELKDSGVQYDEVVESWEQGMCGIGLVHRTVRGENTTAPRA